MLSVMIKFEMVEVGLEPTKTEVDSFTDCLRYHLHILPRLGWLLTTETFQTVNYSATGYRLSRTKRSDRLALIRLNQPCGACPTAFT